MWHNFVWPSGYQFGILIAIALVSLLGQVVLTQAFSSDNLIVVSVVRYIGIVFNITWGWLFWDEVPLMLSLMGAGWWWYRAFQLGLRSKRRRPDIHTRQTDRYTPNNSSGRKAANA